MDNIAYITANGVPHTLMPAFSLRMGGMLTDEQIGILAHGMLQAWGDPKADPGQHALPYASVLQGDPANGQKAFQSNCARCHGADGLGVRTARLHTGSLIDPSYLALVSDQSLRSTIIAGRPTDRMPDWRFDAVGPQAHPMTIQEITDTVRGSPLIGAPRPASPIHNVRNLIAPERRLLLNSPLEHPAESGNEDASPEAKATAHSRRTFLFKISLLLNGVVGGALAVPILSYLLGPAMKTGTPIGDWVDLGSIEHFPIGKTRLVDFENPTRTFVDGDTGKAACWVRRISYQQFQVFATNCAHLGCPVRWFSESKLFMCPCHGGAYYQDGSRASGPPERGLFEYRYKLTTAGLAIHVGDMPTLTTQAPCSEKPLVQIMPSQASPA